MLEITPVPAFEDNYIWVIRNPVSDHVAVVDPGDEDPVFEILDEKHWTLNTILITHHHGDHTGGISALTRRYPVPVYGPATERIQGITHPLLGGETIVLPQLDIEFRVLSVPGHTRGHIAYYGHGALFCGDTLFTGGCGRLFEGSPEQMFSSLEKIAALPDTTQVYCAHEYTQDNLRFARVVEPENQDLLERIDLTRQLRSENQPTVPASLELEKKTNPFLRCNRPNVTLAAEKFARKPLKSGVETFAVVRYWKDTLD